MDTNQKAVATPATAGTGAVGEHPEPADRQRVKHDGPLRTAVVVNPARVEGLDELRATIEETLAAAGWPVPLWFETTPEDPGAGQARQAVAEGAEVVFVSGGDGTVRSCVQGLAGSEAALAVLPAGTGNLLATNLGLPDDPTEGVRLAVDRGRHLLDIGEVDGQAFAVMAGMGFDAKLLEDASTTLKARVGSLAYVLSALKHLRDRPMRVQIQIDDDPPLRRRARTVVVGNVGRLQGGVRLLADAEPDNGQLDVAILAPRHLTDWVALAWGILRRHEHVPRMEVLRGSRITITSDRDQPCQLDGDVIDPRRVLAATVRPAALWLCVYQPDRSPDLAEGSPNKR
ncbi:diacylglycerol/lipid kinase family protein [Georgenia yuyongxinii]|uniref:diacylglycerol/lipid kinase family protein n=1 Tax=Georgenia yuyongxinii TaxID=2589797 RepID=UPI001E2E25F4|nr:diacylglycerol kinase family lipid kinase [Georgenia yuyongxinii]